MVEERRGAEHGGDEGEEGERHRQRHPGHRQIQRQLRAAEQHGQRHRPRLPSRRRSSRACGGVQRGSSRSSLRLFHRDARGGRRAVGRGGMGREAASDTRSGDGRERRRRHDHLDWTCTRRDPVARPCGCGLRLASRDDTAGRAGERGEQGRVIASDRDRPERTDCTSLRPVAVTTAVHHPIKSLTAEIICQNTTTGARAVFSSGIWGRSFNGLWVELLISFYQTYNLKQRYADGQRINRFGDRKSTVWSAEILSNTYKQMDSSIPKEKENCST